jgi:hypothetical protein
MMPFEKGDLPPKVLYHQIPASYPGDRNRITNKDRELQLELASGQTQTIIPAQKARYLGVILEPDLKGKAHLEHARGRAAKSIQALHTLASST